MKNRALLTVFCLAALAVGAQEALSPEQFLQTGHSEGIIVVAYSPNSRRIVTSSFDKTVKVWDADSGRELRTLAGHSSRVESIAYSPDSRRIVSGSADMTIKIWDTEAGREIRTLAGHEGNVRAIVYSPDGMYILSASIDKTLKIWDAETGREIKSLAGHSRGVVTAAYSPDGRRIASGSNDETIKIWDAETGREIKTLTGHTKALDEVSFSPDGKRIVSTSSAKDIKIWDAETGGELRTILVGDFVYSARFSPDGGRIICGSDDKTVKIFDAQTGREIRSLAGHGDYVPTVAYSPDGRRILSGSGDNTAKIWDAATGAEIITLGIPAPLTQDMIAEYLALAGDSAAKTGAFSGPSLYRAGPRETALQFGALVSKTLAETRFLDPQNSAALRRGEALLQSVAAKGGVSRAEMQDYLRQGIAAEVDKHFNTKYGDFIPAEVYNEYKRKNPIDALALVRNAITDFFLNPNRNTYAVLTGIHARYWMNGGLNRHSFGYSARESFYITLDALSPALAKRVSDDVSQNATALARIPNDPQYNIFSNPPR